MPSRGPLPGLASKFGEDFLTAGGLRILTNVLEKDALPLDIDYDIRQSAYFISLQVLYSTLHHSLGWLPIMDHIFVKCHPNQKNF